MIAVKKKVMSLGTQLSLLQMLAVFRASAGEDLKKLARRFCFTRSEAREVMDVLKIKNPRLRAEVYKIAKEFG